MNITRIKRSSFTRRWLLGSTALGILSSHAATITWTGNGADTNYDTPGNWTPSAPGDADELVFPESASAFDVALNGTFSPSKLTFSANSGLGYLVDGTGTLAGSGLIIEQNGTAPLIIGGNNSFSSGEIRVNAGSLSLSAVNLITNTCYALGATGNTIKIAPGACLDLNGQGGAVNSTAASRRYYSVELAGDGIEIAPGEFSGAITTSATGNLSFVGYGKTGLRNLVLTGDASINVPTGVVFDAGYGSTTTNGSITSSSATVRTLSKTGGGTLHLAGTTPASWSG